MPANKRMQRTRQSVTDFAKREMRATLPRRWRMTPNTALQMDKGKSHASLSLPLSLVVRRHMRDYLVVRIAQGLLLICTLVGGASLACGDRPVYSTQREDGVTYGLFISDASFDEMHGWRPGNGEPPVSIGEAVTKGEEWGLEHFVKYDGVQVSGITLQWTRCSTAAPKWYYLIEVTPLFDGHTVRPAARFVAVFLDGSVTALKEVE